MPKIVAIVQARLGSTRLPQKVARQIIGIPMIDHVVERTQRSRFINEVVIATTEADLDRPLVKYCNLKNWSVFTGSENDVLHRYWQCAAHHSADFVVRITSDCPLIDPEIIDAVVKLQLADTSSDYSCNFHPNRKFPRGLDVECFPFSTLDRVHQSASEPNLREHVTLMVYCRPDLFKLKGIRCTRDLSKWRWTVDTKEDLQLVRTIFNHFGHNRFSWREAAKLVHKNPFWQKINENIEQKAA